MQSQPQVCVVKVWAIALTENVRSSVKHSGYGNLLGDAEAEVQLNGVYGDLLGDVNIDNDASIG